MVVLSTHRRSVSFPSSGKSGAEPEIHSYPHSTIEMGLLVSGVDYLQAQRLRRQLRKDLSEMVGRVDAVLMPTTPAPAPQDLTTTGDAVFQTPWTSGGLPTITLPSGLAGSGLPLGIQLAGLPFAEGKLLGVARWCEETLGVDLWPPDYL